MTDREPATDPWAWLHEPPADTSGDLRAHGVAALVVGETSSDEVARLLLDLHASTFPPSQVIVAGSLPDAIAAANTDWLWLFPRPVGVAPETLETLLRAATAAARIAAVGPLILQPRRRGAPIVDSCGLTVSPSGRLIGVIEQGEPDQGQLRSEAVLGLDPSGLLIRRDVLDEVGGLSDGPPEALAGVELGRRINLAGHRVITEPSARVTRPPAGAADAAQQRRWELTLAAAHAPASARRRLRLVLGALLAVVGFVLGKDLPAARAELSGLRAWLAHPAEEQQFREGLAAVPDADPSRIAPLLPSRRQWLAAGLEGLAARVADWLAEIGDRGNDPTIDELTGDDFADASAGRRRSSPLLLGAVILGVLSLLAARGLFGEGSLVAADLLPAPGLAGLLEAWLAPVPGQPGTAGPAWLGLIGLGSLITAGQVEWLVTALVALGVLLTWFAALRALDQLVPDRRAVLLGSLLYAVAPALTGALGRGMLGTLLWALLLPLMVHAAVRWWRGGGVRMAGAVALLLLLATALLPLAWPLAVLALAVLVAAGPLRHRWGQALLVALAPAVILLGDSAAGWFRHPGRWLTGTSPALAATVPPTPLELLLAVPGGAAQPVVVVALLWGLAFAGAVRRPRTAGVALLTAAAALAVAVVLTRQLVEVLPGVVARPQPQPWTVLMLGALVVAAAIGLGDLATAGVARSVVGAVTATAVAATTVALGWWAWVGTDGVHRSPLRALPPFVTVAMTSPTPTRTLALERTAGGVRWALLSDDLPRLGDDERALGDTPQLRLAESVVGRLLDGSADDDLVPDLRRLGVGHVWVAGADPELRTALGNVPGLGTGTGDDRIAVWPVPDSARAMVLDGQLTRPTGSGEVLPAGPAQRQLVLAEPVDARWWASLDGTPLLPTTLPDGRPAFALGGGPGVVRFGLTPTPPWWAWVQAGTVLVLLGLAAPARRPGGPRRSAGGRR